MMPCSENRNRTGTRTEQKTAPRGEGEGQGLLEIARAGATSGADSGLGVTEAAE